MSQKSQRINQMIDILQKRNGASIRQLSKELNVTEMTIRRDLEVLRTNNLVNIIHGAAIFNPEAEKADDDTKYNVFHEQDVMNRAKNRIGKTAARMIEPNDVIFIDIGTTAAAMAKYIPNGYPITVACFTMNTLQEVLIKNVEQLIFGGGYYHPNTQVFESPESLQTISNVRATKAFITAAGVSLELGLTCANKSEVETKRACIHNALETILLVDSSKFGQVKPAFFAEINQINTIVTDAGLSEEWQDAIKQLGIKLVISV